MICPDWDPDCNVCPWEKDCDTGATIGIIFGVAFVHVFIPFVINQCSEVKSYMRCLSMCWYVPFFPWALLLILVSTSVIDEPESFFHLLTVVFTPMMYLGVFMESCCCSQEEEFLSESSTQDETIAYIAR